MVNALFDIQGQTAVITGGSGVLGSAMAHGLAQAGATVVVIGLHEEKTRAVVDAISAQGGQALAIACNVLERADLQRALEQVTATFGPLDILINAAGGNAPEATTSANNPFFELDRVAIDSVFALNFTGTLLSCQVFGRSMAERGQGCIVNIASMNALRPLTRIPAYSAAKAAVANFTQWLAVHMAQEYSFQIRVNAISPGFFLTEKNGFFLPGAETGAWTPRGQAILHHTPMTSFGET